MADCHASKSIVIIGSSSQHYIYSFFLTEAGGGVIGACSAYYLTRHPLFDPKKHLIAVIEATNVAGGSSGKAGGMLATYASPECLAQLSFKLHQQLADEHNGRTWGYRRVPCAEFSATGQGSKRSPGLYVPNCDGAVCPLADYPSKLDWIIPNSIKSYNKVGDANHTAQVHPDIFTTAISRLAEKQGAKVILGKVTTINYKDSGNVVESVNYMARNGGENITIEATDVLIAAGPWTSTIFPRAPIGGARSHSIIIHPSRPLSGFTLWPDIAPGPGGRPKALILPEIYSRPDGTVYSCGPTDYNVPLPPTSDKVAVNNQSCNEILDAVGSIFKELDGGNILARQACYRPIVVINRERQQTGPLLVETGIDGLLIVTGHDSWGIHNSAATGKVMSKMIFDGKALSADISSLDPKRLLKITTHD